MSVRRDATKRRMNERLWAPWRLAYIVGSSRTAASKRTCIFCEASRARYPKKSFLIARSAHSLAMLNIYPYNNGHIMIAPRRHVSDPSMLTSDELSDVMQLTISMQMILKKVLRPDGFNIGMNLGDIAGAGIKDHIHMHIVPRWKGDTNFMPVTAHTKVISQSLESLYKLIMKEIRP